MVSTLIIMPFAETIHFSRMFVVGGFLSPLIIGPFQRKIQLCIKVEEEELWG